MYHPRERGAIPNWAQRRSCDKPAPIKGKGDDTSNELNLKYCTDCYSCIPENKVCKLDDDLAFVLDHVRRADKVIIAEPAYFLGGHTAMKVLMDRLLSILMNYREFEGKECVLVASYGLHKWEGLVKEDMIILAREFNLTIVDSAVLLATLPGDSVTGENLKIVTRLAQSLMRPRQRLSLKMES